jgi:hypothetical protein
MRITRLLYLLCLLLILPLVIAACQPGFRAGNRPDGAVSRLSTAATIVEVGTRTPQNLTRAYPARKTSFAQVVADASTIAVAPDSCPGNHPMHLSQHVNGQRIMSGESPIWASLPAAAAASQHLAHQFYDLDGGWPLDISWETATGYPHPITLRAINDANGQLLKWHISPSASGPAGSTGPYLTMNPILNSRSSLRFWSSQLLIPSAGCYTIEAVWPEGYWRVTFPAGL